MPRSQQSEASPAQDEFPKEGVELFSPDGRSVRTYSQIEHTSLVFGHGYSTEKPKDPLPEPEVPPPPPGA
jgi:hypothetical protein